MGLFAKRQCATILIFHQTIQNFTNFQKEAFRNKMWLWNTMPRKRTISYRAWLIWVLTLSQTTNFGLFQTQRVCRQQFQVWQRWSKVLQMGRKYCEKRRNCSLRAISPFPKVFSKDLFFRNVKTRACLGKY